MFKEIAHHSIIARETIPSYLLHVTGKFGHTVHHLDREPQLKAGGGGISEGSRGDLSRSNLSFSSHTPQNKVCIISEPV